MQNVRKKSTLFRNLLTRPGIIVAPGVYDALSARICEMAGFEAVQHSGYGTAAVQLGKPDVGLLTMTEMAAQVARIARAVDIPVLGDSDDGFGNALNAWRTTQEYIMAGAAGLFMEDQVSPKRCGHMEGKLLISTEEMMGKLKATIDARNDLDPDFVIIYRTDAIAVHGIEDAIDRAKRALEQGVDMIFVEAMETLDQIERIATTIEAPLMLNLIEGGKTPLLSYEEAEELGYKYVVPGLTTLFSAAKGMYEVMKRVRSEGVAMENKEKLFSFREFAEVVKLDEVFEMEKKYLTKKTLNQKYHGDGGIIGDK
jgi:methylisocitrate lyase